MNVLPVRFGKVTGQYKGQAEAAREALEKAVQASVREVPWLNCTAYQPKLRISISVAEPRTMTPTHHGPPKNRQIIWNIVPGKGCPGHFAVRARIWFEGIDVTDPQRADLWTIAQSVEAKVVEKLKAESAIFLDVKIPGRKKVKLMDYYVKL